MRRADSSRGRSGARSSRRQEDSRDAGPVRSQGPPGGARSSFHRAGTARRDRSSYLVRGCVSFVKPKSEWQICRSRCSSTVSCFVRFKRQHSCLQINSFRPGGELFSVWHLSFLSAQSKCMQELGKAKMHCHSTAKTQSFFEPPFET